MKNLKMMIIGCLLLSSVTVLYAEAPTWLVSLQDAIIGQELTSRDVMPIYAAAKTQAERIPSELDRFIMLARCENLMGLVFESEGNRNEAAAYYSRAESLAKSAIKIQTTSESLYVLAESIANQCNVRGFLYQVANGMRFLNTANRAVELDPNNYDALYLLAACYAFPSPPMQNLNKAAGYLNDILANDNAARYVRFNAYYAMGVISQKQKNPNDARAWFTRALDLYPTNKDAQQRLSEV